MRAEKPRTNVSVPNPDVRRSTPAISTIAGEVTAHQADKKVPKIMEQMTKLQYSAQNGNARGAIAPTPREMTVTIKAFTHERSVMKPEMIRPMVFVMPTIDSRNEALTSSIPLALANEGMNMYGMYSPCVAKKLENVRSMNGALVRSLGVHELFMIVLKMFPIF